MKTKATVTMKKTRPYILLLLVLALASCRSYEEPSGDQAPFRPDDLTLKEVARIFSDLPFDLDNMGEVHDAVSSSSGNGYDEEYMISDLLSSPGAGVGTKGLPVRSGSYTRPMKDLLVEYINDRYATKSGGAVQFIERLSASDMQIYWPYSEDWDGETYPIVTFDPGYGAESNYGYEVRFDGDGLRVVDSVYVDESVARSRPVWVINRNDDSAFTPLDMFLSKAPALPAASSGSGSMLMLKSFKALRNYDSWFGGASEFFVKFGAVDGFKAANDNDLHLYTPSVTDFVIVVKRSMIGEEVPFQAILLTDFTDQMEKMAFLIVEDDGGTVTSWKCSATVKFKSKSYGFDLEIPYKDKDDIVWRGQLAASFLRQSSQVSGRFGDVVVKFETR